MQATNQKHDVEAERDRPVTINTTTSSDNTDNTINTTTIHHICKKCNFEWSTIKYPNRCRKCNSIYWNDDKKNHKCVMCGNEWKSYNEPKTCLKCKSPFWKTGRKKNMCKRCGYTWLPRLKRMSVHCPKCYTYDW